MTRAEAIKIASGRDLDNPVAHDVVIILERLGLLKLEEPKTATAKAADAINRHIMSSGGKTIDSASLCLVLNASGVRVIDK